MPVIARAFVRKMRGGAQAHLIEGDDGHHYVVKFRNNPQHRRILANEWLASAIYRYLQIPTPPTAVVACPPEFLAANPEVYIQLGTKRVPPEPGWHFGSRYPGHPDRLAVYDFLPEQLLAGVYNRRDFLGALAADKWIGNTDARQAVFFRAQLREWAPAEAGPLRKAFLAVMIDHGFAFNGPHWDFPDAPIQGLYFRHGVYDAVRSLDDFEPWLARIRTFPEEALDEAVRSLPAEWTAGDEAALEKLVGQLLKRRKKVADWIEATRKTTIRPFANW
jgi:hypothetical protein